MKYRKLLAAAMSAVMVLSGCNAGAPADKPAETSPVTEEVTTTMTAESTTTAGSTTTAEVNSTTTASAEPEPELPKSDFGYVVYNNTVHIYGYSGTDKDVVIPENIGEYKVTRVSLPLKVDNDDLDIETVTLPKTVSEVQRPDNWMDRTEKSYYVDDENENFTSVDGVIYSKDRSVLFIFPIAREGEFTIPDCVTEIHGGAFYGCEKLSVVNIGSSVMTIGVQAFEYSSVSEVNIADGLESIEWEAFCWTKKLERIVLPKTLKSIECRAFEGSALRSLTLPTAIDEFGADVFTMTELSEINLVDNGDGLYMWNDILCKGDELIRMVKGSKVEKLVFDRTLTSLDYIFENCTNLKVIEIMDDCDFIITMTEFGDFIGCTSIEQMYIPGSVVSCPFYHYYQEMSPDLVVYTPEKGENSSDGRNSGEKCKFVYVDSYEDYLKAVRETG